MAAAKGNRNAVKEGDKRLKYEVPLGEGDTVQISLSNTRAKQRRALFAELARAELGREPTPSEIVEFARQRTYAWIDAGAQIPQA